MAKINLPLDATVGEMSKTHTKRKATQLRALIYRMKIQNHRKINLTLRQTALSQFSNTKPLPSLTCLHRANPNHHGLNHLVYHFLGSSSQPLVLQGCHYNCVLIPKHPVIPPENVFGPPKHLPIKHQTHLRRYDWRILKN